MGGARVENLQATVNPSMDIGLLGGEFVNNFIYRVDAARGVITLSATETLRGGLAAARWRQQFQMRREPPARLDSYLENHPGLRRQERAELTRRREELVARLDALEREANALDVPQIWRH